jgi:hypothetical protein
MSASEHFLPATAWWDELIRHYEARQAVVTGWPELPAYIHLLRQMAASPYAGVVRPWRMLDLLVLAREAGGPPRASSDTIQVAPRRELQIVRMQGGMARQLPVAQATSNYRDAWRHLERELHKLVNHVDHACLRFVPSRVEGLRDVAEVAIFPDRLVLWSVGKWVAFRFTDMTLWPRPAWLWRLLSRFGWRPRPLCVGERDWFHPPRDRFFAFFTTPRIVVYLTDEPETGYGNTLFFRVQEVMRAGGFSTFDLG